MKRGWVVVAVVGILALGAAAQVTREEFDELAGEVRAVRTQLALLKMRHKALMERIEALEPAPEVTKEQPTDVFEDDVEWKRPKLAPFAIVPEPDSGALDVDDLPIWIETAHCQRRGLCDGCLGSETWHNDQSQRFSMPDFGTCPFGETVAAGKARRLDLITERVRAGLVTPENAYRVAILLGVLEDGDPAPWDDESSIGAPIWEDRRRGVAVRCGGGCGGLCFACPVLST